MDKGEQKARLLNSTVAQPTQPQLNRNCTALLRIVPCRATKNQTQAKYVRANHIQTKDDWGRTWYVLCASVGRSLQ